MSSNQREGQRKETKRNIVKEKKSAIRESSKGEQGEKIYEQKGKERRKFIGEKR